MCYYHTMPAQYRKPTRSGFTLIELLVVISIIAILAVVGVVTFVNVQKNARDSKRKVDLNAIAKAFEVKYNITGSYGDLTPANNNNLFASGSFPKDPHGAEYTIVQNSETKGFRICASLQDSPACSTPATTCFCKTSIQADPPALSGSSGGGGTSFVTNPGAAKPSCPTDNLIGHWTMDEGSSPGIIDNARSFNGTSDLVGNISTNNLPTGSQPISMFAWIKTSRTSRQTIISYGSSGTGQTASLNSGQLGNNGNFVVDPYGAALDSGVSVSDDRWHDVGLSYPGNTTSMTIYIDGRAYPATLSLVPNITPGTNLQIGRWVTSGPGDTTPYFYGGLIDDVRIYKAALNQDQVSALYGGGQGCK